MESGVARPVVHRGDNAAIRLRHVWSWYEQLNERLVSVMHWGVRRMASRNSGPNCLVCSCSCEIDW